MRQEIRRPTRRSHIKKRLIVKSNNLEECKEIISILTEFAQIDFTDYLLSSTITQPRAIDTEIEESFSKCLPRSMEENIKIYKEELSILHEIKRKDNINLIDNFINANGNLFLNEDIKKKFKDEIIKIEKIFFENSSKNILQYHFNKPFNYKTKVQYRKDFSILNVSIVMSLLLNILIFYVSYFLRIRLKFLNPFTPSRWVSLFFQTFSKSFSLPNTILNLFIAIYIFSLR